MGKDLKGKELGKAELHYTTCLSMQKRMKSCIAIPVKNL